VDRGVWVVITTTSLPIETTPGAVLAEMTGGVSVHEAMKRSEKEIAKNWE